MKCRDCKQWERVSKKSDIAYHGFHAGYCNSDKFDYGDSPEVDGLVYWDFEGYSAGFMTGEDFGCIHFEKGKRK